MCQCPRVRATRQMLLPAPRTRCKIQFDNLGVQCGCAEIPVYFVGERTWRALEKKNRSLYLLSAQAHSGKRRRLSPQSAFISACNSASQLKMGHVLAKPVFVEKYALESCV